MDLKIGNGFVFYKHASELVTMDNFEKIKDIIHMCQTDMIYFNQRKSFIGKENKPKYYDINSIHMKNGFPYIIDNNCVISEKYLDDLINNTTSFDHVIAKSTEKEKSSSLIPSVIYQTFQSRLIPKAIDDATNSWKELNPEYSWKYFSDIDCRNYIKENFNKDVLKAYDSLIPGSYKSDLWRYCIIYKEGGVYADIKFGAVVSLSEIIDKDTELVITNDIDDKRMYNAFFAAKPKHPVILKCIKEVVRRVNNKEYGHSYLYTTGPILMGDCFFPYLGTCKCLPVGKHGKIQVFELKIINKDEHILFIVDKNGKKLINRRHSKEIFYDEYTNSITGIKHYAELWNERKIFKN